MYDVTDRVFNDGIEIGIQKTFEAIRNGMEENGFTKEQINKILDQSRNKLDFEGNKKQKAV